jgi:hypothetical protein
MVNDVQTDADISRTKQVIIRTLRYYPNISRSMLGLHVRPAHKNWDEVLEKLVEEGVVVREAVIRDTNRSSVIFRVSDDYDADAE